MKHSRLGKQTEPSLINKNQYIKKIRVEQKQKIEIDQIKHIKSQNDGSSKSKQIRNYSSQSRYKTPISNSFQRRSVSCKRKISQSVILNRKMNTNSLSISLKRLSNSSQKNQSTSKNLNPWGGPPIAKACVKQTTYQILQNQKKSLLYLNNLKQEIQNKQLFVPSTIKYKQKKITYQDKKIKMKPRALQEYAEFIKADCDYNVGFDFSYLRSLDKNQVLNVVDMSYVKIVESIMLCVLDVLRGETKADEKGSLKLLTQYALFYFGLFEKILTQFVIYNHYFKLIQLKLVNYFVLTRLYFVILCETAKFQPQTIKKHKNKFQSTLNLIVSVKKLLFNEKKQSNDQNPVVQTFKILKNISAIEKRINEINVFMQDLIQITTHEPRIATIRKELQIFQKLQVLGGLELQFLAQAECIIGWNYYQIPPIPYLPQKQEQRPYTLVVTLTETLVYFNKQKQVILFRPYVELFLEKASQMFELVVWADEKKSFSDPIIDSIQNGTKRFVFRLYSEHFSLSNKILGRNLSRLGRQTQKTYILRSKIDQNQDVRQAFQKGLFVVQRFQGDRNDRKLLNLLNLMQLMSKNKSQNMLLNSIFKRPLSRVQEEMQENYTISTQKQP